MQYDRQKNDPAQPAGDQEAGSDSDPVKERVDYQPKEHRVAAVAAGKLCMRLLAKVKVPGDCMFKKMNDEISHQHEQRRFGAGKFHAFGKHLQKCGADHEACAERHKITQVAPLPVFSYDYSSAQAVSQC